MSVNDEKQWHWWAEEKRFIADALTAGKIVLGICLGAQLMASALGARTDPGSEKEIGWFPVMEEDQSPESFAFPWSIMVFHWREETFELLPGGWYLANSRACRHQAFQIGEWVQGLQFHLEMTPIMLDCRIELAKVRVAASIVGPTCQDTEPSSAEATPEKPLRDQVRPTRSLRADLKPHLGILEMAGFGFLDLRGAGSVGVLLAPIGRDCLTADDVNNRLPGRMATMTATGQPDARIGERTDGLGKSAPPRQKSKIRSALGNSCAVADDRTCQTWISSRKINPGAK